MLGPERLLCKHAKMHAAINGTQHAAPAVVSQMPVGCLAFTEGPAHPSLNPCPQAIFGQPATFTPNTTHVILVAIMLVLLVNLRR